MRTWSLNICHVIKSGNNWIVCTKRKFCANEHVFRSLIETSGIFRNAVYLLGTTKTDDRVTLGKTYFYREKFLIKKSSSSIYPKFVIS